jgi:SAM-dependent methyltransferase
MDDTDSFFHSAHWYDLSINWSARLGREIPLLREVFGPPGERGLLDAGCGTGRQTAELARQGYRATGLDADDTMLSIARQHAKESGAAVEFVAGTYDELPDRAPGPFDGIYCLGNALAACADREVTRRAVGNFAAVLRPGGRLFVQVLNFPPMRSERPCVRGPRVVTHDGVEYVSTRVFQFVGDVAEVTNVTHYKQERWRCHSHCGRLYPIAPDEMDAWCGESGLRIDERLAGYDRSPFKPDGLTDLIVVATKR